MLIEKIQLDRDETILLQVRRHWFVLLMQLLGPLLLAILPPLALHAIVASPLALASPLTTNGDALTPLLWLLYTAWLLLLWLAGFTIWTHYYLDVLTVTNERIILVDQRGLFTRTVASFRLERMQDIYVEIDGLIPTLLDYGTIHAETASDTTEEFRAAYIPKPRDVKATILRASDTLINRRYTSGMS